MHCSQCRVLFVLLGIIVMSHIFVLILPCVQFFTGESIFLYVNVILCRNLLPSLVKESAEAASSSEGPLFPCQCAQHKGVLFGMSSGRMWPVQTHCLPHGCWWWLEQAPEREVSETKSPGRVWSCFMFCYSMSAARRVMIEQIDWSRGCNCRGFGSGRRKGYPELDPHKKFHTVACLSTSLWENCSCLYWCKADAGFLCAQKMQILKCCP